MRSPITPATALSLAARFVAIGGTGYAAIALPKGNVGSEQIKQNAVTSGNGSSVGIRGRQPHGAEFSFLAP